MKTQKAVIVLTLCFTWSLVIPAQAHAPIMKHVPRLNAQALAFKQPKAYARLLIRGRGWTRADYVCVVKLWTHESNWNPKSKNKQSTAFGIGQLLNETSKLPAIQISNGLRYINSRYGNPCNAWKHWRTHYWY